METYEVDTEVLTALEKSLRSLHKRISESGEKLEKSFRTAKIHERGDQIERLTEIVDACHLTYDEMEKSMASVGTLKKDNEELTKMCEVEMGRVEHLLKGHAMCPECVGTGRINLNDCKKCEGKGWKE